MFNNPPCCCMGGYYREYRMTPEWLHAAIKAKLSDYPLNIAKEDINVMEINIKSLSRTILVAFMNKDMRDGLFIVYENINNEYKEIYERRGPVINVQTYWDVNLVFTTRLGSGTGYWIDQLYVLRFTDKECKEVFSDYAQYVKVLPEIEPGTQIIGNVAFDTPDHMVYTKLNMTILPNGSIDTENVKCTSKFLHYNYNTEGFV